MSKRSLSILILSLIIISLGIIVSLYVFRPSEDSVEKQKADITIDAGSLLNNFETNEQKANTLYLDQVISVSGTIAEINEDEQYVSLTLREPDALSGVSCTFNKETLDGRSFRKGEKVTVKGVCTGYLLDVVLTKCALAD